MITRALIVVLALLNVSVALWWLLRGEPASVPPEQPVGVAQLQFLGAGQGTASASAATALADATPAPAPPAAAADAAHGEEAAPLKAAADQAAAAPPAEPLAPTAVPLPTPAPAPAASAAAAATPAPAAPARCAAFGPFDDRAAAADAQRRAGAALLQARLHSQVTAAANARYRVMLPPAASREDAQAIVARIQAAGLSDYYIIAQGPEANAIALGQYRNREGAQRRLAVLQAAGFQARLSGGEDVSQWWLQGRLADGQGAEPLRQRTGARRQQSLDCTAVR